MATRTHGASQTPLYRIWRDMIRRCEDPKRNRYDNYGGRGIKVCQRWRHDFAAFAADMGPRPSKAHSLDRIDNDGDYEPGNVEWSTHTKQARNRRSNTMLTVDGRSMCIAAWSDECGISQATLCYRVLKFGWDHKRAVTEPVHRRNATIRTATKGE